MTPFTTIGVASDPPPPNRGGGASPFSENVQADFSVAAFFALICVRDEYRVLAMSWLYEGQSPSAAFASAAWLRTAKQKSSANPPKKVPRTVRCEIVPIRSTSYHVADRNPSIRPELVSTPNRQHQERSHDCERGTHECVRHIIAGAKMKPISR